MCNLSMNSFIVRTLSVIYCVSSSIAYHQLFAEKYEGIILRCKE